VPVSRKAALRPSSTAGIAQMVGGGYVWSLNHCNKVNLTVLGLIPWESLTYIILLANHASALGQGFIL